MPILSDISDYLISRNFTKQDTISHNDYYNSTKVTCVLSGATVMPADLYCANITDYAASVAAVAPFVQAYVADNPTLDISSLVFRAPNIKDGSSGYQNARVSVSSLDVGGSDSLFYRQDNGVWKFFLSVQTGVMSCNYYNTNETRLAFSGDQCTNDAGADDTVK
jgi:hypothetical protein